jgi:hypothetical protein
MTDWPTLREWMMDEQVYYVMSSDGEILDELVGADDLNDSGLSFGWNAEEGVWVVLRAEEEEE